MSPWEVAPSQSWTTLNTSGGTSSPPPCNLVGHHDDIMMQDILIVSTQYTLTNELNVVSTHQCIQMAHPDQNMTHV